MNRTCRTLIGAALVLVGLAVLSGTTLQACELGCSPGYWKNHTSAWPATYLPTDPVTKYFSAFGAPAGMTLLQALGGGGGPGLEGAELILLRAAVASLLNAAAIGMPNFVEPDWVILVETDPALQSGDRDTMLAVATKLDGWNNLGCPF